MVDILLNQSLNVPNQEVVIKLVNQIVIFLEMHVNEQRLSEWAVMVILELKQFVIL